MNPAEIFAITVALLLASWLFRRGILSVLRGVREVQHERLELVRAISGMSTLVSSMFARAEHSISAEVGAVASMIADIPTDRIELPHPGTDSGAAYSTPKAALFDKILREVESPLYVANERQFMYVSRSFARLLGYPLTEMVGRNWSRFVDPALLALFDISLAESAGRIFHIKTRIRRKDGGWQSVEIERRVDEDGAIELCFVTDLGRAEQTTMLPRKRRGENKDG